eukprot:CAMPEP_0202843394 /NCGR_PEP_ID=MMETSP1389-20130828/64183_1 /ASSEMBLY_ACC=CAM_ASM_000865 /TAXON_ID=302021 /ORGANISM="Rhodomonas sp., Strain CCMP768" /LENGTH=50 /DNA_ID=CAMNT_0049520533 /DNA_START=142 /DNA_END=291 /DNA_ORIENTATION=+
MMMHLPHLFGSHRGRDPRKNPPAWLRDSDTAGEVLWRAVGAFPVNEGFGE